MLACHLFYVILLYICTYVCAFTPMQSHYNSEDFTLFTLDDVDAVFDHMTRLKYSQTYQLQGEQCSTSSCLHDT